MVMTLNTIQSAQSMKEGIDELNFIIKNFCLQKNNINGMGK